MSAIGCSVIKDIMGICCYNMISTIIRLIPTSISILFITFYIHNLTFKIHSEEEESVIATRIIIVPAYCFHISTYYVAFIFKGGKKEYVAAVFVWKIFPCGISSFFKSVYRKAMFVTFKKVEILIQFIQCYDSICWRIIVIKEMIET